MQTTLVTIFKILIFSFFINGCFSSTSGVKKDTNNSNINEKATKLTEKDKRDFFPIGVYFIRGQKTIQSDTDDSNDPAFVPLENDFRYNSTVAKDEYFREFQDLKSYGFNTAVLMINPLIHPQTDKTQALEVVDSIIGAAEEASIKIVVPMNHTEELISQKNENITQKDIKDALEKDYIDKFLESNATLGYQIFDEPVPFGESGILGPEYKEVKQEQLGEINDAILELDSSAFVLCSWNNIKSMELLNQGMHPDVLLMDLYPFAVEAYTGFQTGGDTPFGDLSDAFPRGREDDGSFNLGKSQPSFSKSIQKAQIVADDKPVWLAFQAFGGDTYWRNPLPIELRLQANIAIKEGVKGLFYFMYQSEDWAEGMMDINYKETPLILEAKKINKKINKLAPTLLKLTKTTNHATSNKAGVQTFVHTNGDKYLIAVNKDINKTKSINIYIDKSWLTKTDKAIDIYTDKNLTISSKNDDLLKLTLKIAPADIKVLLLKN
jgi:hypothetical protein